LEINAVDSLEAVVMFNQNALRCIAVIFCIIAVRTYKMRLTHRAESVQRLAAGWIEERPDFEFR
jgi:hypothetical protein